MGQIANQMALEMITKIIKKTKDAKKKKKQIKR